MKAVPLVFDDPNGLVIRSRPIRALGRHAVAHVGLDPLHDGASTIIEARLSYHGSHELKDWRELTSATTALPALLSIVRENLEHGWVRVQVKFLTARTAGSSPAVEGSVEFGEA